MKEINNTFANVDFNQSSLARLAKARWRRRIVAVAIDKDAIKPTSSRMASLGNGANAHNRFEEVNRLMSKLELFQTLLHISRS